MSTTTLNKTEVKHSFIWSAIELYAGQIVQFAIGVVLARLLSPEDYGAIALTTIFICVSEAIFSSGFPTALLRKKDDNELDFSTAFCFNTIIALILFSLLWICAPFVAQFYSIPILLWVLRFMGFTFLIGSFGNVSATILKKKLKFKGIALITLFSSVVTGIIAIIFAYRGCGVWSLVIQAILSSLIKTICMIVYAKWMPRFKFSISSFRDMFGFGSKILGSSLITQAYQNMYSIIIGKIFSASAVGFFTRADGYSKLVPINISGVIQRSLLPLLMKIQDNDEALISFNQKMLQVVSFFVFPLSLIMAGLSYPLISVMLTDKWLQTVPLLQILCIGVLPDHLYCINNDFLLVKGRSDLLMKEQVVTKIMSIVLLIVAIPLGLKWVAISKGASSLITWGYSTIYLRKVLAIDVNSILRGLMAPFVSSMIIGVGVYVLFHHISYTFFHLVIVGFVSIGVYLVLARLFFYQNITILKNLKQ